MGGAEGEVWGVFREVRVLWLESGNNKGLRQELSLRLALPPARNLNGEGVSQVALSCLNQVFNKKHNY